MSGVDVQVVALGAALVTASGAGTWKAASLRSDTIAKYRPRMDLARAGLDERAADALRRLALRTNRFLGDDGEFDPLQAIVDPAELRVYVDDFGAALAARQALPRCYRNLLRVGPALMVLLGLAIPALVVAFSYYAGWTRARLVGQLGGAVAIVLALAVAGVFIYYAVAQQRFSAAEVLALPSEADD